MLAESENRAMNKSAGAGQESASTTSGGNDSGGTGREHEYSTERKSWRCHVLPWLEVRHIIRGVACVCHQRRMTLPI